jgi:hypothetical protein
MENSEFLYDDYYFMKINNNLKFLPQYYFDDDTLFHYTNYTSGILITSSNKLRFY